MVIERFLEKDEAARKIFGKKEIEIVKKQLHGIPLTQSEKNRLSRDIRPKLEFMKRAIEYEDEFDLEKNSVNKKIIQDAKETILEDKLSDEIKAILLFGSHAKKTQTFRSDIDICVVFKQELSKKEATEFRLRVMSKIHSKVDVQVFNQLPFNIKKEIASTHKVLYSTGFDNINFTKNTIMKASDTERLAET